MKTACPAVNRSMSRVRIVLKRRMERLCGALSQRIAYSVKRIVFILFLASIFYFLPSVRIVYGQSLSTSATQQNTTAGLSTTTNPDVPKNLHTWTQNVMIEVMAAMTCQLAGVDPVNPNQQCLGVDPKTNKIGFVPSAGSGQAGGGGAIAVMGNLIAMTYTPPLRTGDYFGYLAQNFGIAKPALAQQTGTGFDGIKPLLGLWVAFRNIVYMFFVAVFIIIGFGIMLRINIDPRTVMAISNQLPKIIIAILLVTFSFAIAGFLIDIMWASIYVTYNVIADAKVTKIEDGKEKVIDLSNLNPTNMAGKTAIAVFDSKPPDGRSSLDPRNLFGNVFWIASDLAGSTKDVIRPLIGLDPAIGNYEKNEDDFLKWIKDGAGALGLTPNALTSPLNWIVNIVSVTSAISYASKVATIVGSWSAFGFSIPVGTITSGIAGLAIYSGMQLTLREAIPYLIPFTIIITALLWALFRIWFQLIIAYVAILVDIVFAPFWIIAGLIPGSPIDFGAWLRDMLANLSAFPVTIGMFLLGKVFIETFNGATGPFVPPLVGNFANTNLFGSIIGLGILLMTPQAVTMMKDLFKSPQFKHTAAIGQAIGVGTGVTNLPGHAQTIGTSLFGLSHFPGASKIPFIGRFIPGAPQH